MSLFESEIRPLCFPKAREIRVHPCVDNSPINNLSKKIILERFIRDLPEINEEQFVSSVVGQILLPLKRIDRQPFGSEWNRLTAISAAKSLGVPDDHLLRLLSKDGPLSRRLKARQAEISLAFEQACEIKAKEREKSLKPEISKQIWVKEQLAICDNLFKDHKQLSKSDKQAIKIKAVGALIDFINKFGDQTFGRPELLQKIITSLTSRQALKIIDIHCPTFRHSNNGIEVIPSAKDQLLINSTGKTVVVSQWDTLEEIMETAAIFTKNGIETEIVVAVVDIDEFVMSGQENSVKKFASSLEAEILDKGITAKIILVSQLCRTSSLNSPETSFAWQKWRQLFSGTATLAMRLVGEEFERLQKTVLPKEMKTQQFAAEMAGRRFVVHFILGQTLPKIFPNGIIMLRARGNEISEIDRLGAKIAGLKTFIINHWRERKVIK